MGKFDKHLAGLQRWRFTMKWPKHQSRMVPKYYNSMAIKPTMSYMMTSMCIPPYYDVLKSREGKWRIQDFSCAALVWDYRLGPTLLLSSLWVWEEEEQEWMRMNDAYEQLPVVYGHIILTMAHHRFNDRYVRLGLARLSLYSYHLMVQLTTGEPRDPLCLQLYMEDITYGQQKDDVMAISNAYTRPVLT